VSKSGNAKLFQVLRRQAREDPIVYLVFAERGLILFRHRAAHKLVVLPLTGNIEVNSAARSLNHQWPKATGNRLVLGLFQRVELAWLRYMRGPVAWTYAHAAERAVVEDEAG
jgi:hypothetical protein